MTKPVYVVDLDAVEDFITAVRLDQNNVSLARELRRYAKGLVNDDALEADVPSAFGGAGWALAYTGGQYTLTVTTLPANNGSTINGLRYSIDGVYHSLPVATGTYPLGNGGLASLTVSISARNSLGWGASAAKTFEKP